MSSTVIGNTSLSSFDVIVIGSGAGGAPVADILTRHAIYLQEEMLVLLPWS